MSWSEVRQELIELSQRNPNPLLRYPDPHIGRDRRLPVRIRLQPWAAPVAAHLHHLFGSQMVLSVGNFSYPERTWVDRFGDPSPTAPDSLLRADQVELADPREIFMAIPEGLAVISGYEADATLRLTNSREWAIDLLRPTCQIVDPTTGQVVGGSLCQPPNPLPPWNFSVRAAHSVLVPLRVGSSSYEPDLGYTVAPGSWALRVFLPFADRRLVRAPLIPISIRPDGDLRVS